MIKNALIRLIEFYQNHLSRLKGTPSCRFTPTCSEYAVRALREWGVLAGLALTVWRILRCNPFSRGGYDPVPQRRKKNNKGR